MSTKDRFPYETATVLDQSFLDSCADNLTNKLEMICEIETPTGTIYVSDRNKYVGERFYEARLTFPTISRTIGEWLSEEIEFSTLELELNNADGAYNSILPGGASFASWIGKAVVVRLGLRDVESTYRPVFEGTITEVGGVSRSVRSVRIIARNKWDKLSVKFPTEAFTLTEFPYLENDKEGLLKPYILGDWTTEIQDNLAIVPAFPVNGNDPQVYDGARNKVRCVISVNDMSVFDSTKVYLRRGSDMFLVATADISDVPSQKNGFSVTQNGATVIQRPGADPEPYVFETGDEFFCRVTGPQLFGSYRDNAIMQAYEILQVYGGVSFMEFTSDWLTLRDKMSPAQSAIRIISSRVWVQEAQSVLDYAVSLLEQVRCEAFIDANGKLGIFPLHFEEWPAAPSFQVRNWDIERNSFQPSVDERTNFNRAQGVFSYNPATQENAQATAYHKNNASISQVGKSISKVLVYPNLYKRADVESQVVETLRISSAFAELVTCNLTWRALLLDLSDFVALNVQIGAVQFSGVPAMVRSVGYNPAGLKLEAKLWSFQLVPFPGWTGAGGGIVGGYNATITKE